MPRKFCVLSFLSLNFVLLGCATAPPGPAPLTPWLRSQSEISWRHLQENISPHESKLPGGPRPLAGIVVAALSKKNPDYYFHWVRDSSLVMSSVVRLLSTPPFRDQDRLDQMMGDYLHLSRHLQKLPNAMGEPRFTVDGQIDSLPWSRPQYDGPGLRVLTISDYLAQVKDSSHRALALEVLKTDLDFIAKIWRERGFDIWEEYRADNYNTRLVHLAALERGQHWAAKNYAQPIHELEKLLDDHWDPARGFYRSQLAIVATDGYTAKKTDLDSAVLVTVIDAGRKSGRHSVLDDRVQATVQVLEDLFRSYPINKDAESLFYGRYSGDKYFGGNPWYLITAYYAQFYLQLSQKLDRFDLLVTETNLKFLSSLLKKHTDLKAGQVILASSPLHSELVSACHSRAEGILLRLRSVTPPDGQLYEQIDKIKGHPLSSRGIGWAHGAFLQVAFDFLTPHVPVP